VFGIIEHIRDEAKALAEIRRVSRPGAIIYFTYIQLLFSAPGCQLHSPQHVWLSVRLSKELGNKSARGATTRLFTIGRVEYVHADRDMPLVRTFDKAAAWAFPKWARYIHVTCELDT